VSAANTLEAPPSPSEVRAHLAGILESPQFRTSKRCQELLTYLVAQVQEGRQDALKERVIGVEVFGRPTDYNPASDPIVRVSAADVRKRLAQYYQEAVPGDRMPRIRIATGHYIPDFTWRQGPRAEPEAPEKRAVRGWYRPAAAVAVVGAVLSVAWIVWRPVSALDKFWGPAIQSRRTPLILAEQYGPSSFVHRFNGELRKFDPELPASAKLLGSDLAETFGRSVMSGNVFALRNLDRLFLSAGQDPELRLGGELTMADLAERPIVLIGYFNNPWAKTVNTEKPRFTLATERRGDLFVHIIRDGQDPARQWSISSDRPWFENTPVSYAIVTRIYDRNSGRFLVSIGGMTHLATSAASDFVTHASYLKELQGKAPWGWEKRNVQAVLQTNIVNQTAAPPKLLATHFW
jgi:hypothetical protein